MTVYEFKYEKGKNYQTYRIEFGITVKDYKKDRTVRSYIKEIIDNNQYNKTLLSIYDIEIINGKEVRTYLERDIKLEDYI